MHRSDDKGDQKTRVTIFGTEYVLSSREPNQYTHQIVDFVDQKMNQVAHTERLGDVTRVALMTAFDIADQILRQRVEHQAGRLRAAEAIGRLEQYLDEVQKDGEAA